MAILISISNRNKLQVNLYLQSQPQITVTIRHQKIQVRRRLNFLLDPKNIIIRLVEARKLPIRQQLLLKRKIMAIQIHLDHHTKGVLKTRKRKRFVRAKAGTAETVELQLTVPHHMIMTMYLPHRLIITLSCEFANVESWTGASYLCIKFIRMPLVCYFA